MGVLIVTLAYLSGLWTALFVTRHNWLFPDGPARRTPIRKEPPRGRGGRRSRRAGP